MKGSTLTPRPQVDGLAGVQWVWMTVDDGETIGSIPGAVMIEHGDHRLLAPWVAVPGAPVVFTMDSLVPLSLREKVWCTLCGRAGWIERGAWLPEDEDGRRG